MFQPSILGQNIIPNAESDTDDQLCSTAGLLQSCRVPGRWSHG